MSPQALLIILAAILIADFLLGKILELLNLKNIVEDLPEEVRDIYEEEKYRKSIRYTRATTRFGMITSTFNFILSFSLIVGGFFGWFDGLLREWISGEVYLAMAFFAILFLLSDLINTPFQVYGTFVLEERFGFNKTTPSTFVLDKLKGYVLAVLIGGGVLYVFLNLVLFFGQDFWWYFWVVAALFMLFMNMFYTSLILPLFNKLKPLEEGPLKEGIEAYSRQVHFPLDNIFVIDGSKRSSKSNAFFSGIGRKKKIVLYDTLIENHSTDELIAVLAHEVGHFKKKHIVWGYVNSLLQTGLMLFIMSRMLFSPLLSYALGGAQMSIHLNLLAFGILYTPVANVIAVLTNMISRKNEYEADRFAGTTYGADHLIQALKKLSVHNLSNLFPHKAHVFFNYSHPPLLKRIKALKAYL
jgi:STE24 endopeptidase